MFSRPRYQRRRHDAEPAACGRPQAHWGRIATDAGLPDDRKHKAHSLRVSHTTMVAALGGDASGSLLHSDPATTRKHYLDARLLPSAEPQLMVPWLPPPAA